VSIRILEQKMSKIFFGMSCLAAIALTGNAAAHHSAAPFDFSKPVTVLAKVKAFEVINPHSHVVMSITDKAGTRDVSFEGHSASNFFRAGYSRGSVSVGDQISVTYAPRRDGKDGGFLLAFTTKAGKKVGFGPA
jgi:hypothetical protein